MLFSKVQMLEQQFNDFQLDVVGIQEGRSRMMQERSGLYYNMYVAAANERGSYGVQIWARRKSKWRVIQWHVISLVVLSWR